MADIAQSSWSEIDALNNQAAPLGWTPGVMLPTGVEPTAQAMMGAMKRWWNRQNPIYAATLTTTDTYVVSPQTPITSFTSFELWRVRMPSANTSTSPTITWGPSAATIQKYNNGSLVNLAVGDIQAQYYEFFFNNTVMVMINPAAQTSVTGPASSTTGDLASYADGTGKVIADSGLPKAFIVKNAVTSTSQSIPVFTDTSGTVIGNGFVVGNAANNIPQLTSSATLINTIAASGVATGSYTSASIVVGTDGRVTAASQGPITPFTAKFTSAQTALPGNGATTSVAHGLGAVPFGVLIYLVCQTGEGGYSAGDTVLLPSGGWPISTSVSVGLGVFIDGTNVSVISASNGAINIANKASGAAFTITNGNWKFVAKAWV